jgi:hypothetical protein
VDLLSSAIYETIQVANSYDLYCKATIVAILAIPTTQARQFSAHPQAAQSARKTRHALAAKSPAQEAPIQRN